MIRLGVIGLGAAGQAFLPAIAAHPTVAIAALCDARPETCAPFSAAYNVPAFSDLDAMIVAGGLDAVYVGTPTDLHLVHASRALRAGLHVLVEKPMAVTPDDAWAMAGLAAKTGRVLVVGHSHGHDLPIHEMARIIRSRRLGAVRMLNTTCHTDWVYRPRRPEELRPDLGGGVTYRQGAHQFDILCTLAGAPVVSVMAQTFDWDPNRPTIGAHSAILLFANGAVGTAVYNGYGHFRSSDLTGGVGEWGFPAEPAKPRSSSGSEPEELARKQARALAAIPNDAPHQPHFGLTIVSCEGGTLRQSPDGLLIHTDGGVETLTLPVDRSPRQLVLDEFAAAIHGTPACHDGAHGAAIIEICAAVLASGASGQSVRLGYSAQTAPAVPKLGRK